MRADCATTRPQEHFKRTYNRMERTEQPAAGESAITPPPPSVAEIAAFWKMEKEGMTDVVVPYGATEIPEKAFNLCSSLTSIVIPDSVTTIGERAFYGCTSLKTASIPSGATLESDAFSKSPTTVTRRG